MHLANYFNLTLMEFMTVLSGAGLVVSLATLITILLLARKGLILKAGNGIGGEGRPWKEWIAESESICEGFSKHLEEKREIGKRLLEQLDERMERLQGLVTEIDGKRQSQSQGTSRKDPYTEVLEMVRAGYDVTEIVKRSSLPRGEVELILGLHQFQQP
jgi:hypothetical protein